jgi:hypothetical protein
VQLEQKDLSDDAKARVSQIWKQAVLSPQTTQQNVGIDPQGQIELAKEIEARLQELTPLLCWTGQPTYDQTKEIFDLAWRHFKVKSGSGVRSASQLTLLVNRCRIPDDCIDSKRYPLFMARAVLKELIESLQSTQGVKPC